MPNQITTTGLETLTQAELVAQFTADFQAIYGPDIVLTSDSPDGQLMMLFIQAVLDLEDLLTEIYNGIDPDNATGVVLDQRVAINGIQRNGGTYSTTNASLVISQSLNLYGLDQSVEDVYTVSDNAGTQWKLASTQIGVTVGTHVYEFRAKDPGATLTVPNTITVPVTIVLGVDSINNPSVQLTIGVNEETDVQLKLRRSKSTAISSQGILNGLLAMLLDIDGVTYAFIHENNTGATDSYGVTEHAIWVIVAGSYADASVANAIYVKRNLGCNMFSSGGSGKKSYGVVQADGSTFTVYWDDVVPVPLFITLVATSLDKSNPPDLAAIRSGLNAVFLPNVATQVNINDLATAIQSIDSNVLITSPGFSIGTVQTITLSGVAASGAFKFSYGAQSTASIAWNDNAATMQTRLRALTGLSSVTVAGSIGSQSIVVTMTGVTDPSLIGYNTNTLQTVAPAAITMAFLSTFANTLSPATLNKQFAVTATDIILLGMILAGGTDIAYNINSTTGVVTNTTLTIAATGTFTFAALGGYGSYVYSVATGTGSTIDATTGAYVAGTAGTDTVTATDAQGRTATCTVTIS